jgi:Ca2+-binding EF-hand superfamily protein
MESKVFKSLDRDCDNVLRINEFKQLFFNLGFKATDEDITKLIAYITGGTSKDVDEPTLTQFMLESITSNSTEEATELFKTIAFAQKGLIVAEEIRVFLEANGVVLTEEEAGELVLQHKKRSDTPNGTLTLEEFATMLS